MGYSQKVEPWRGQRSYSFIDVDCAADKLGAHTAAVTTKGKVFTWGQGGALGHGNTTTISVPKMVDSQADGHRVKSDLRRLLHNGPHREGLAGRWGKLASGRLGHGSLPKCVSARRGAGAGPQIAQHAATKAVPRFLLRPQRIDRLKGTHIKDVAAGEAHSLAVDRWRLCPGDGAMKASLGSAVWRYHVPDAVGWNV